MSCNQTFLILLYYISTAQCLEINQKVSLNIASEASYVYILSRQKLIKNAKMVQFGNLQSNSVTRQLSSNRTKIEGKCQNSEIKCDILKNLQTMCCSVIRSIRICIQTYLASSFCFL